MTIMFILPLAKKYYLNPTFTTIGSTNYPVWQVRTFLGNFFFKQKANEALRFKRNFWKPVHVATKFRPKYWRSPWDEDPNSRKLLSFLLFFFRTVRLTTAEASILVGLYL